MIYLASPYSDPDPAVRKRRFEATCAYAVEAIGEGQLIYSPIVHSHALAERGLPGDWEFWAEHNRVMLPRCKAVVVLALAGWERSIGLQAEVGYARALGLPIRVVAEVEKCREAS